ncbi:MAG TPA: cation:proton antiporter [Methylomirabilota bacterium]|nr:cation:proton antiporter [Methylomirabilota bacterium]
MLAVIAAAGAGAFGPLLAALALLVAAAKAAGLMAQRWGQPAVLGELVVGIVVGNLVPRLLGEETRALVGGDPTLAFLAQLGILLLLFDVGLETNLRAFVRVGRSAVLVAVIGIVVPGLLGWVVAVWWLPGSSGLAHVFVGAALTATSVGITARVLKDLGASASREAQIIIGAAILDDVLGLVVLAVVSGMATAAAGAGGLDVTAIGGILLRAVMFLGAAAVLGHFLSAPIVRMAGGTGRETMLVLGLALCFGLAWASEHLGLADIIGAFAAGMMLDPYGKGVRARADQPTLAEMLHPLSAVFGPLFFVLMGARIDLGLALSASVLALAALLTFGAVAGKLACALGVVEPGANRLAVGIGMVPRGEVGLIFAGIGAGLVVAERPLLDARIFSAIVLMVLVTTVVTPVGLRWVLQRDHIVRRSDRTDAAGH